MRSIFITKAQSENQAVEGPALRAAASHEGHEGLDQVSGEGEDPWPHGLAGQDAAPDPPLIQSGSSWNQYLRHMTIY